MIRMSDSLLKTKQQIILTKCCANNSFQIINHCNWPIQTHNFRASMSFLRGFFTKIHFKTVEKKFSARQETNCLSLSNAKDISKNVTRILILNF